MSTYFEHTKVFRSSLQSLYLYVDIDFMLHKNKKNYSQCWYMTEFVEENTVVKWVKR